MQATHHIECRSSIIDDLRDTFNCKLSSGVAHIPGITTGVHSFNLTANHIEKRLENACKRVSGIEVSMHQSVKGNRVASMEGSLSRKRMAKGGLLSCGCDWKQR
jgi:hypothetical protein